MKIVFTAKGITWESAIDPRFGRTEYLVVYDDQKDELTSIDNREIDGVAHGAGPQTAQKLMAINPDVLITGNGPGGNAGRVLTEGNLKIYIGAGSMTLKQAFASFQKGELPLA